MAFGALLAVPAIASAGNVTTAGSVITYTGDAAADTVTVTDSGADSYTIAETLISESSANCTDSGDAVTCTGVVWTSVVANLGTGADIFTATGVNDDPFTVNGEADGDTLSGSVVADTVSGGAGNDTVAGLDANDTLNGGDDNDALVGGDGDDDLNGDGGNDRIDPGDDSFFGGGDNDIDGGTGIDRLVYGIVPGFTYTCTSQALTVDMDNAADDNGCDSLGSVNNNVRDSVESVTGSTMGDTITGSCLANTFAGSNGTASGHTDGNDTLNGDPNTCAGGNGTDFLGGGEGNDTFNCDGSTGAAGLDTVTYGTPYTAGAAISVTLDSTPNDTDGMGSVTDNVIGDCERIIGTANGDTINAAGALQGVQLFGRLGGDTLTGSGFNDVLNGEGGTDTGNCGAGAADVAISIETPSNCEL